MTAISSILDRCLNDLSLLADSDSPDRTPEVSSLQWQDELGRLRVWSGNIGAHKTGLSSLDYRLRDSSHIRNEILKLLQRMLNLFQDFREVMSEEDNPEEKRALSEEYNLEELALDESPELTEVQQIYHNVIDIINFLFRITMASRQPSGHDLLLGVKIRDTSFFEPWAKQHIFEKYPEADGYLVDRLSASMARQKAVLKYREKHRRKLSQGVFSHTENYTMKMSDAIAIDTNDQLQFSSTASISSNSGVPQTSYAPSLLNSQQTISIPPVPRKSANRNPFECPYCYHIITVENENDWARHLFHDLMPYVCVFDHCPCPSRPYNSRQKWYNHLVEVHPLHFNPSSDLLCPLCKSKVPSVMYQRHVGQHLEELGLFVLPPIDTEYEDILSSEDRNLKIIQEPKEPDDSLGTRNAINQINQNESMIKYRPKNITPDLEAERPDPEIEEPTEDPTKELAIKDLSIGEPSFKESSVEKTKAEIPEPGAERQHSNPKSQSQSYKFLGRCIYLCCQCNDGPKPYSVEPQCITCNHVVCYSCNFISV